MNPGDPNVARIEVVAAALGDLCEELVFVGGCAASLLIDTPSAPPTRVTYDVDVIAEVAALSGYYALEKRFAERGFARDMSEGAPICRWHVQDVEVDLMPTDERILGFSNRWYPAAVASASSIALPSGRRIRVACLPGSEISRAVAESGFCKCPAGTGGLRRSLPKPDPHSTRSYVCYCRTRRPMNSATIVQKLWNYCNALRDDGMS